MDRCTRGYDEYELHSEESELDMPSGGSTSISEREYDLFRKGLQRASVHGLQKEFMMYFLGGIVHNRLPVGMAISAALTEWDM